MAPKKHSHADDSKKKKASRAKSAEESSDDDVEEEEEEELDDNGDSDEENASVHKDSMFPDVEEDPEKIEWEDATSNQEIPSSAVNDMFESTSWEDLPDTSMITEPVPAAVVAPSPMKPVHKSPARPASSKKVAAEKQATPRLPVVSPARESSIPAVVLAAKTSLKNMSNEDKIEALKKKLTEEPVGRKWMNPRVIMRKNYPDDDKYFKEAQYIYSKDASDAGAKGTKSIAFPKILKTQEEKKAYEENLIADVKKLDSATKKRLKAEYKTCKESYDKQNKTNDDDIENWFRENDDIVKKIRALGGDVDIKSKKGRKPGKGKKSPKRETSKKASPVSKPKGRRKTEDVSSSEDDSSSSDEESGSEREEGEIKAKEKPRQATTTTTTTSKKTSAKPAASKKEDVKSKSTTTTTTSVSANEPSKKTKPVDDHQLAVYQANDGNGWKERAKLVASVTQIFGEHRAKLDEIDREASSKRDDIDREASNKRQKCIASMISQAVNMIVEE